MGSFKGIMYTHAESTFSISHWHENSASNQSRSCNSVRYSVIDDHIYLFIFLLFIDSMIDFCREINIGVCDLV